MPTGEITLDDPRAEDVRALLARHHAFANVHTPPEHVHALDVDALLDPAVAFFSFRRDGTALGIAALRQLDPQHAEVKSMHTAAEARGLGIGGALVDHLIAVARERGFRRVSLETGSAAAFAPAHALYVSRGFEPCAPFGDYRPTPHSCFMTLVMAAPS